MSAEKIANLKQRAAELRRLGDEKWADGKKDASTTCHREAAELEQEAKALEKTLAVPQEIEPGLIGRDLAPGQTQRCLIQDHAGKRVHENLERMRERLENKRILAMFSFTLYALNCEQHKGAHIDLITSDIEKLPPESLVHVIAATEALLVRLKSRQG